MNLEEFYKKSKKLILANHLNFSILLKKFDF